LFRSGNAYQDKGDLKMALKLFDMAIKLGSKQGWCSAMYPMKDPGKGLH